MKYEFHRGDYVETKTGTIGFVCSTTYVEDEYPCWMPTKLSSVDIRDDLYSLNNFYFIIDEDIERRFNRIGKYDFAKKAEDKDDDKIEPLCKEYIKSFPLCEVTNMGYTSECHSFDLGVIGKKINELVEAVNRLGEKVNGMAQS